MMDEMDLHGMRQQYPNSILVGALSEELSSHQESVLATNDPAHIIDLFLEPGCDIERIENLLTASGSFPEMFRFVLTVPGSSIKRVVEAYAARRWEAKAAFYAAPADDYLEVLLKRFPEVFNSDEKGELLSGVML